MDVQNPATTSQAIASSPSANRNTSVSRSFDCAICYETLANPGPPLTSFTFGRLLRNVSDLPALEREYIYREFGLDDQCFTNGQFDCDKILYTVCGHMFHSGCIREWFFVKRTDRYPRCPFCNKRTCYEECRILYPLSCNCDNEDEPVNIEAEEDGTEVPAESANESEYSDISGTSSSWPSDNDSSASDDDVDDEEANHEEQPDTSSSSSSDGDNDEDYNNQEENEILLEDTRLYYPEYIHPTNGNNGQRVKSEGKLGSMFQFIGKFNLVHVITLINIIQCACKLYWIKKEKFWDEIKDAEEKCEEDEELFDIDREALVPLGYDLIGLVFITGLFISAGEKYAEIFKRKRENDMSISGPVMIMHYFTFNVFATLCLLITHDMLFY